jgi:threonine/homoserine/homoserine lactone efflux protein
MVSGGQLAAFAVASLILIAIPGPGVLFVVGRALSHGRNTALASVLGHALGNYAVAICVALGIGSIVARSATVFTVVKLAGAAYLAWLGIQAFRHRKSLARVLDEAVVPQGGAASLRQGVVVGLTNPKTVILFAAVLPQFVNRPAGYVPAQMLVLSAIAVLIGLASDCCYGLSAAAVRSWFARSPRRLELVGGIGGLAMVGLGVTLAFTGRND